MFREQQENVRRAARWCAALWAVMALWAGGAWESQAQNPPPNDNLANAQIIVGASGLVTGTNLLATAETGEPAPYTNNPAQFSIWFLWTAPVSTTIDFNTRNSTDTNGYDLDTVLAVYSLKSGTNLAMTNLTLVAQNEQDYSGGVDSRVDFAATLEKEYLIQVDGAETNGVNAEGYIVLNWGPSLVGGTFQFTTTVFPMGEYDDGFLVQPPGSVSPSIHNAQGAPNGRITVTRTGGYNGRCEMRLTVTNFLYTNYYITNYTGTNIFLTNWVLTNFGGPDTLVRDSYTNTFYTNTASEQQIEDNLNGVEYYLTNYFDFTNTLVIQSNGVTGVAVGPGTGGGYVPVGGTTLNITNYFTNFPCYGNITGPVFYITNSSGSVTDVVTAQTNIFCITFMTNIVTASAVDGLDYFSGDSTNITFDDFQMSKDVYLTLPGDPLGPDYPDSAGNFSYFGINASVELILTPVPGQVDRYRNPTLLDPLEDPDIVTPQISGSLGKTVMNVQNLYSPGPPIYTTNVPFGGYVAFNFERATFRCNKNVGSVTIWVLREPTGGPAEQVSYVIDTDETDWTHHILTDNRFPRVAGSEYALPFNGNADWDFCLPYNDQFGNPAFPTNIVLTTQNNGTYGTLMFPENSIDPQPIVIPIYDNGAVEFDSDLYVQLFLTTADLGADQNPPCFVGNIANANVTINFNGVDNGVQPAGAVDRTWNVDGEKTSYPANNPLPGADQPVEAIAVQANGLPVIGGSFTAYNSTPDNRVARLESNGQLDFGFNTFLGSGPNGTVRAIAIDSVGRIYIGGDFTSVNGTNANHIARLLSTGALDLSFVTGSGFTYGGTVYALAIDGNGNIVVGGGFSSFNSTTCSNIARLLPSGSADLSFLPSAYTFPNLGTDQAVRAVAIDTLGNIVLGGDFTLLNGTNWNHLGRLLPSGALDTSFNPGIGADNSVFSLAVQPNNNAILLGGAFLNYNNVSRGSIARLTSSGALDTSFDPGTGANDVINSVVLQADGNILIGGQFTSFNTTRRVGMARLFPSGWLDTYFMDTAYNQFAGLINHYYNPYAVNDADAPAESNQRNSINAMAIDLTTNVIVGGNFVRVGGGYTRDDVHNRHNLARIIGPANTGPEPGGIGNCPGNITMIENPYTVDNTAGKLYVGLQRVNGSLGEAAVTLGTNTLQGGATRADFGLAAAFSTYRDIWDIWNIIINGGGEEYGWRSSDGWYSFNYNLLPNISDNNAAALGLKVYNDLSIGYGTNLFAGLSLQNLNSFGLLSLGGQSIPTLPALGQYSAGLEIINDNYPPGVIGFAVTNTTTLDTNGNVTITLVRTNGNTGQATVIWCTADGSTNGPPGVVAAHSPSDYQAAFGQTATFNGNTTVPITVHIAGKNTLQPTKYFTILITNISGAALDTNTPPLVPSSTVVEIIDGNFQPGHLEFSQPSYSTYKGLPATVTVNRVGGAKGQLNVYCGTSDGTGTNTINYTGVTNLLTFQTGSITPQTMTIQTLQDYFVEGAKTVNVFLFGATNQGVTSSTSNNQILAFPSNVVLTIEDVDSYGTFSFSAPNYNILQNAGQALITVVRTGGTVGAATVNYSTFNTTNIPAGYGEALAGTNYGAVNGVLTFAPGVTSTNFVVPIYYTPGETTPANRVASLVLFSGSPAAISNQFPKSAVLTILDNQLVLSPAGSVDLTTDNGLGFNDYVTSLALQPNGDLLAGGNFTFFNQYPYNYVSRLNGDGSYDSTFLFGQAGANGTVDQVLSQVASGSQTAGNVLIVGGFSQVDQVNLAGVARLNVDGSLDGTFNPGAGADNTVYAIAQQFLPGATTNSASVPYYVIGGDFVNFDGYPSPGVARLTQAGQLDATFTPGSGVSGSNGIVRVVAIDANNLILLGGDFISFNNTAHHHLVRLNVDGSVDSNFLTFDGIANEINGSIRAIEIQPDSRILIGGLFTTINGSNYNYVARLNNNGTLDTNFNVGAGCDNPVLAITLDSQNRILLGGEFTHASGVTRYGITRLNPDGTVDPTINFGFGANGFVDTIVIETNDEIDVGGGFTTFNNVPENNFVRLYGGANSGDGSIEFSQAAYGVLENATNAFITIQRIGGEGTAAQPTVSAVLTTSDGSGAGGAVNGTDYIGVTNTVTFPLGETFQTVAVPIINGNTVGPNKTNYLNLSSNVYAALGPQVSSEIIITNVNTALAFSAGSYSQSANAASGSAAIAIVRQGNPNSYVAVNVYTGTNGSAVPGVNYTPVTNTTVQFFPEQTTAYVLVPVLNSPTTFSDVTVDLEMDDASNCIVGSPSSALLTIDSVLNAPGVFAFSQTNYTVSEGATNAIITIVRTNGDYGTVRLNLATSNLTAVAGVNYMSVSTNITFSSGQISNNVSIPVIQLTNAGPDTTVLLNLSILPGYSGSIGGLTNEVLTIQNDIANFSFSSANYLVSEGSSAVTLSILRNGPTNGTVSVVYTTYSPTNANETNGYAVPNVDYVPTKGTNVFVPGETLQTVPVDILQGTAVNGLETFQVLLENPSPGVQIGVPGTATVGIESDVTGFAFSTNSYTVGENGSNIVITVNRINQNTGDVYVRFSTSDGTGTNGVDYVATNGTLFFPDGTATNYFVVPILNPSVVESNKTFNLTLSRPSPNSYLVAPSNAVVIITNVYTGVSFGSPIFTVSECGVSTAIPVVLTGVTNNTASVNFATTDGSGTAGTNYFATNGTLIFQPGQTEQSFAVQVINNHVIGPDHTVNLSLSSSVNAQLLNPSTALLTIQECNGAYIVKSGTAFEGGSIQPGTGVIYPNDTVTIAFGLRDIAGGGTSNLVATMLATNGVTNVVAPATYGELIQNGPTVARPFTFTAMGTNGQNITATMSLADGTTNLGKVAFGFTLGGFSTAFTNAEPITILDSPNPPTRATNGFGPGYGYPSVITASGIPAGVVTKVSVTLSNFGHQFPHDVDTMLEGPGGESSILFSKCGNGNYPVQNVTLTFDPSAGATVPLTGYITSGTYLPTGNPTNIMAQLPTVLGGVQGVPAAPLAPYSANLGAFVGGQANGIWALWIVDTVTLDAGVVTNGWVLDISSGAPVEADADLELAVTPTPAQATISNQLTYAVTVTNYGPAGASNVVVGEPIPPGAVYVGNSCGCATSNNGVLTFALPNLAVGAGTAFSFTVMPTNLGYITNIGTALATQPDPNSNNVITNITLVGPPSADVGVSMTGSPNPDMVGLDVTYVITVTNGGPSAATGVTAIDVLPGGFLLVSTNASTGTVSNNAANGTITWVITNLPATGGGAGPTLTLVAVPTNAEIGLNQVTVSSPVYDPYKLNNFAAVKTEVDGATISAVISGASYSLTWASTLTNYVLQGAFNLPPPGAVGGWNSITSPPPPVVNGQYVFSLPGSDGYHFFRLKAQVP